MARKKKEADWRDGVTESGIVPGRIETRVLKFGVLGHTFDILGPGVKPGDRKKGQVVPPGMDVDPNTAIGYRRLYGTPDDEIYLVWA